MEVGAVKQAFNNEVIQLKRNLNQAKIHIIHKLTRKAKTFAEKKAPDKLKEKLKRKAESAVNEVLILKKIKPRDIARFTVTHTGNLQDYLNKPIVDQDKACARLLLHKSLQEKYKIIRNTFSGISIKDLLMSRNERLKLKKEALLDKKMKRDKKKKVVNAEGEWDVENINTSKIKDVKKNISKKNQSVRESEDDEEMEFDEKDKSDDEEANSNDDEATSDAEKASSGDQNDEKGDDEGQSDESDAGAIIETDPESGDNEEQSDNDNEEQSNNEEEDQSDNEVEEESDSEETETSAKAKRNQSIKPSPVNPEPEVKNVSSAITFDQLGKNRRKPEIKKPNKPKDMQKNKNLKEKLQSRKFKKDSNESQVKETKTVDPFFITASGENYMSVAEPRQPDEVKEIHKQGNRQERRAVMFGHVPKVKPRQNFRDDSNRQNDSNGFRRKNQPEEGRYNRGNEGFRNRNDSKFRGKNDEFRGRNDRSSEGGNNQFRGRNDKPFGGRNNQFKGRNDRPTEGRNDQFKGRNDSKFKGRSTDLGEPKVEKLHPSWEAKRKQSGIKPFQGKKIVFDEG